MTRHTQVSGDRVVQVTIGDTVINGKLSHLLGLARRHSGGSDAAVTMTLHCAECPDCTATRRWVPQVIQGGEAPSEGA
jgi:hypothetical protein